MSVMQRGEQRVRSFDGRVYVAEGQQVRVLAGDVIDLGGGGGGPDLSDAAPLAPGTAGPGVSEEASRADHVHPSQSVDAADVSGLGSAALADTTDFLGATAGAGGALSGNYPNPGLNEESVQDLVGAMFSGNAETGIAATYDDTNGKVDLAAEVTSSSLASAISTHAGATDPHGDRAYAAGLVDDLSGVTNASGARGNLGLGGAATLSVGTAAGTVAAGDDSRLSDGRAPLWRRLTFSNADYNLGSAPSPAVAGSVALMQTGTLSAARVVTLPAASAVPAGGEVIVNGGAGVSSTNTVTVQRAGSDTINGAATSVTIGTPYGQRRFVSDGVSAWTHDDGLMRRSQNLSDLGSAATARTNLGQAWYEHSRTILGSSAAQVQVTGLAATGARAIRLLLSGRTTTTGSNAVTIRMTLNSDSGSNYNSDGSDVSYLVAGVVPGSQTNTNRNGHVVVTIACRSGAWPTVNCLGSYVPSTTNTSTTNSNRGAWRSTTAIDTIELFSYFGGDFAAGTEVVVEVLV